MNCSSCYEIKVECCKDFILPVNLTGSTSYYVVFRKPGSMRIFQKLLTSNAEGDILISKADFPAGYFVSGVFHNVEIRQGTDYKIIVPLLFEDDTYNCLLVQTMDIGETVSEDNGEDESKILCEVKAGTSEAIAAGIIVGATTYTNERLVNKNYEVMRNGAIISGIDLGDSTEWVSKNLDSDIITFSSPIYEGEWIKIKLV